MKLFLLQFMHFDNPGSFEVAKGHLHFFISIEKAFFRQEFITEMVACSAHQTVF